MKKNLLAASAVTAFCNPKVLVQSATSDCVYLQEYNVKRTLADSVVLPVTVSYQS